MSDTDTAREDIAEQDEIRGEAVPRVRESRGSILFEHEVSDPGKPIPGERYEHKQPQVAGAHRNQRERYHQRSADEMQPAAGQVAMFAQIISIKVREGREAGLH